MDKKEWVESCREYADLVDHATLSDAGEVAHDAGRELVIQALRLKRQLCTTCNGTGRQIYTEGTMWRHDGKLQSVKDDTGKDVFFQIDVCKECWGSGSNAVKGVNLIHIQHDVQRLEERCRELEAEYDKCIFTVREREATIIALQKKLASYLPEKSEDLKPPPPSAPPPKSGRWTGNKY